MSSNLTSQTSHYTIKPRINLSKRLSKLELDIKEIIEEGFDARNSDAAHAPFMKIRFEER